MISVAAYGMQVMTSEANPCIELTKDAPDEAYRGETITFEYSVCNCGDVPLSNVKLVDAVSGMSELYPGTLGVGECWNFSDDYTIPEDWPYEKVCSIAIASGWYEDVMVDDWDCECIVLVPGQPPQPSLQVIKKAVDDDGSYVDVEETALGHDFYWLITVENTGNVDLDVWVNDTDLGLGYSQYFYMTPGQVEEIWLYYAVNPADIGPLDLICNVVEADAWFEDLLLEDDAADCVFVAMPCVDVTKTALTDVAMPGDVIEWEINVTNCGNKDIADLSVNDPLTGDSWDNIALAAGESWTAIVNFTVPIDFCTPCNDVEFVLFVVELEDTICNEVFISACVRQRTLRAE
jgi:uncharacterized repeat protein (TIGR01451 family)